MSRSGRTAVVAFAFGAPYTTQPNQHIAAIAASKARKLNARIYTQRDLRPSADVTTIYTDESRGTPTTLRLARNAVAWAEALGIFELWAVAAPPHLPRVMRDLDVAGREAEANIYIFSFDGVRQYPHDVWFSAESTQPHTQTEEAWNKRERIIMRLPLIVYKIVAR